MEELNDNRTTTSNSDVGPYEYVKEVSFTNITFTDVNGNKYRCVASSNKIVDGILIHHFTLEPPL